MHRALYRKWRPLTFDDVCGQEHITSILKYETGQRQIFPRLPLLRIPWNRQNNLRQIAGARRQLPVAPGRESLR